MPLNLNHISISKQIDFPAKTEKKKTLNRQKKDELNTNKHEIINSEPEKENKLLQTLKHHNTPRPTPEDFRAHILLVVSKCMDDI